MVNALHDFKRVNFQERLLLETGLSKAGHSKKPCFWWLLLGKDACAWPFWTARALPCGCSVPVLFSVHKQGVAILTFHSINQCLSDVDLAEIPPGNTLSHKLLKGVFLHIPVTHLVLVLLGDRIRVCWSDLVWFLGFFTARKGWELCQVIAAYFDQSNRGIICAWEEYPGSHPGKMSWPNLDPWRGIKIEGGAGQVS